MTHHQCNNLQIGSYPFLKHLHRIINHSNSVIINKKFNMSKRKHFQVDLYQFKNRLKFDYVY
jgi:hypothetical protein